MSKVFVNIGLSLDGYMAPEGMTLEHWDTPEYKDWGAKWGAMMSWILKQEYFRENLKFGPGGETGPVNDMLRNTTERIGANIMGKRMFKQGAVSWPEEAPFHTPVYVLTHEEREAWARAGGTTFHFVDEGPEREGSITDHGRKGMSKEGTGKELSAEQREVLLEAEPRGPPERVLRPGCPRIEEEAQARQQRGADGGRHGGRPADRRGIQGAAGTGGVRHEDVELGQDAGRGPGIGWGHLL